MSKIIPVGKYERIPAILIKKHRAMPSIRQWVHKELKEGGRLQRYYEFKRRQTDAALRAVAIRTKDFRQNNKVDARVLAHVPLMTYLMMRKKDEHFWKDDSNLRSYRRDNADAKVYL